MQQEHLFTPKEYEGEFNLLTLERRIAVRELKKTQTIHAASKLLGFSMRSLFRKMNQHQILRSEWKISKPKVIKKSLYGNY